LTKQVHRPNKTSVIWNLFVSKIPAAPCSSLNYTAEKVQTG
jgi:hypothetical protein